ncbi:SGNH/GDSL hydrolase family protein [Patescibacteria group bacterium]|nr:SGNH/GDSL hydrolase family protein [Patescibacteria group bacterium]
MPLFIIPLYYQLLEAYHPQSYNYSSPKINVIETLPSPKPQVLGISNSTSLTTPSIGGEGKIINLVLIGDSMIDTLSQNICQQSLQKYYPTVKFNLLKYGYGSTNIESASKRLNETTTYLGKENPSVFSQNPDIIVIESFAYNNFGNSQKGIDRQSQSLTKITDLIKTESPKTKIILASTIAPNSVSFANGAKDIYYSSLEKIEKTATIKLYLQNIINFASKNNLPLSDAFHPSLFGQNGLEELINSTDNIHPSNLGTELFCDILAKSILDNQLIN